MAATTAPMHKNRTTTMGRISGFISPDSIFKTINLSSQLYSETRPFTSIQYWRLPGGTGAWKAFTFQQIMDQTFEDRVGGWVGQSFGPTWTTHWFKVVINVPDEWAGKEVHLRWNSNSEATLWRNNGSAGDLVQGISPEFREEFILSKSWIPNSGAALTFYYEMACNGLFGAGDGMIVPPNEEKYFKLDRAEIAVFDRTIYKLYTDIDMLHQIADRLPNDHKGYQAMFAANEMVNLMRQEENTKAGAVADAYFAEGNGKKVHRLISIGHCHIDTAWLWPYDETIRKCARSWSAQIRLMAEYPDFTFAVSQAQQYAWMKQYYPEFYTQIKLAVATGQFVPVGGTWVEMDGNIPNGEAFMRQFFYGQRFFREEFGILCKEFWLPDTFGYSAQIPQMMKHVGIQRFMTQKMSWSLVNKFPNHNFWWEGIDGTEVLVHFPPGNSYNMNAKVEEVLFSQNNSEDKGRANVGIYLYGVGDGGGGPTRTMIERQTRLRDVDGIPQVIFETPEYFWRELEKESRKLYKWVGELYLELHNGTYTSQAKIKWFNRKCEFLFREVELAIAIVYSTGVITETELKRDVGIVDRNWKQFLLNQFHDVLPGSCIELVTKDAWKIYEDLFAELTTLRSSYHSIILGSGTTRKAVFNPLSWDVDTVIFNKPDSGTGITPGPNTQVVILDIGLIEGSNEGYYRVPNTFTAALVNMKASGYTLLTPIAPTNPVIFSNLGPLAEYTNGLVRLTVSNFGNPTEALYFTGSSGQEQIVYNDRLTTGTANATLYIYDDVPMFWDAWDVMDYHLETRRLPNYTVHPQFQNFASGPIVGGFKWNGTFGNGSTVTRYTIMRANSPMVEYYLIVDWKESHKFLKVEFPVDILSREATYEIQYGHAKRPTHINTSWDMAKFEVCGHKWMDISQSGKGVTFITDSKYGWHVRDNIVKLSLLRSPKNPDANCDIHKHYIHYAVLPHEGTFQEADVIRRAYELNYLSANNVPALSTGLTSLPQSWVQVENSSIIVEAFKAAHDVPRAIIVRLYESHGGSATTKINFTFAFTKVNECNGLEEPETAEIPKDGNSFTVSFTPFKIRSFLLTL